MLTNLSPSMYLWWRQLATGQLPVAFVIADQLVRNHGKIVVTTSSLSVASGCHPKTVDRTLDAMRDLLLINTFSTRGRGGCIAITWREKRGVVAPFVGELNPGQNDQPNSTATVENLSKDQQHLLISIDPENRTTRGFNGGDLGDFNGDFPRPSDLDLTNAPQISDPSSDLPLRSSASSFSDPLSDIPTAPAKTMETTSSPQPEQQPNRALREKPARIAPDRIPDVAWRYADRLRERLLARAPGMALAAKPWSDAKTGLRLAWADQFRLLAAERERAAKAGGVQWAGWDEIGKTLAWVFENVDSGFVIESPSALRAKFDRILFNRENAARRAATPPASRFADTRPTPEFKKWEPGS